MAVSFSNVYNDLRTIKSAMECAINDKPLYKNDVPPIAQSHTSASIAVDVAGDDLNL
jgi:hypothetical protein